MQSKYEKFNVGLLASRDKKAKNPIKRINNLIKIVGELFSKFAKEVQEEEAFSTEKLRLVKQQYNLIMEEEGANTNPKSGQQPVKPATQRV